MFRFASLVLIVSVLLTSYAVAVEPCLVADAAEARDWDRVEQLIADGADVNAAHADGMTALHWACLRQHAPAVERLLKAKAKVEPKTRYEMTPLCVACSLNSHAIVGSLLEAGADAKQDLAGGVTVLMEAARGGNAESVRLLLEHGADIAEADRRDQTALMWAAASGNVGAIDELIKAGADINAESDGRMTAMFFAAREGQTEAVRRLLKGGVYINYAAEKSGNGNRGIRKGSTALTMAVESGHFELAMVLVNEGADPNDQRSGYTPLHALTWVRKPNRGENPDGDPPPRGSGKLSSLQFARELVDAGADVNMRLEDGKGGRAKLNRKGATPFLMAAKTADLPYLQLLVELGADPSITNVDGSKPIIAVAGVGVTAVGEEPGTIPEVIAVIDYLLKLGADVNSVDDNKETAMHGAAYRNFPEVASHLAKHGADPDKWNHKNKYGWTPVMIAQGKRPGSFKPSPETVQAIEEAMLVRP